MSQRIAPGGLADWETQAISDANRWAWVVAGLGCTACAVMGGLFASLLGRCESVQRTSAVVLLALVLLLDLLGLARFAVSFSSFRGSVQTARRLRVRPIDAPDLQPFSILRAVNLEKLYTTNGKLDEKLAKPYLDHLLKMNEEWRKSDEAKRQSDLLRRRHRSARLSHHFPCSHTWR